MHWFSHGFQVMVPPQRAAARVGDRSQKKRRSTQPVGRDERQHGSVIAVPPWFGSRFEQPIRGILDCQIHFLIHQNPKPAAAPCQLQTSALAHF
jgi:hypothetical protein